jgi:tetratricopeptide (TPR) repeat protein
MILALPFVFAASVEPLREALAASNLPAAETEIRALLADGNHHADLYYNLGNIWYRQGHHPEALLAWRRAALLAPRDADIAANIDFVRRDVIDEIPPAEPVPVWAPWQSALTADEGQWVGATLAGMGLLVVAFRRRFGAAPAAGVGGLAAIVGLLIGAGGVAESALPPAAVVLAPTLTARSDLGAGVDLFALHAGAELLTAEQAGNYVLVVLPDGRKGWVDASGLGLVALDASLPTLPAPSG